MKRKKKLMARELWPSSPPEISLFPKCANKSPERDLSGPIKLGSGTSRRERPRVKPRLSKSLAAASYSWVPTGVLEAPTGRILHDYLLRDTPASRDDYPKNNKLQRLPYLQMAT